MSYVTISNLSETIGTISHVGERDGATWLGLVMDVSITSVTQSVLDEWPLNALPPEERERAVEGARVVVRRYREETSAGHVRRIEELRLIEPE